jgi:hypothetical protein
MVGACDKSRYEHHRAFLIHKSEDEMTIHFLVDQTLIPLNGRLVYRTNDSAFDFERIDAQQLVQRIGQGGSTSLTLGTLQIEIGVGTSIALYVWGYHPQASWRHGELPRIETQPSGVRIALANEGWSDLERGISIGLVEINEWPTIYDAKSGWLCIGSPNMHNSSDCVEFASDTVAVIQGDILTALWLHPKIK